jgi:cytochrome oxidase Cu insertion factor (SCO1/SenC/PrrC family)
MCAPHFLLTAAWALLLAVGVRAADEGSDETQRREQYLRSRPALAEPAPDFVLRDLDGKEFRLKALAGKRPVVIEFGSYT